MRHEDADRQSTMPPLSDRPDGVRRRARRIVMIGTTPEGPGGISSVMRGLLQGPMKDQWPLDVLSTWVPGSSWQRARAFYRALHVLWTQTAAGCVQAVHLHMAARGSFWRKRLITWPLPREIRVIVHIHDGSLVRWHAQQPRWVRQTLVRFLERADAVIALSERWAREWQTLAPRARIVVVQNAVEVPSPSAWHPPWMRPEGIDRWENTGLPRVLFLGRLTAEKGIGDLLLAAQGALLNRHPWQLILAGDGDRVGVQKRARRLGLEAHIDLPGFLDAPAKHQALRAADVLVLPSLAEGQPMAVLEAMAWSVPVVATAVGDVPQLLQGGAGLSVPPGDPGALMRAIQTILRDPPLAQRMGAQGRAHVIRHHSPQSVARRLGALYRDLGLDPLDIDACEPESNVREIRREEG